MAKSEKKNKKPIFKKWWFWVLVVLILGMIGSAIGGGNKNDDKKIGEVSQTAKEDKAPDQESKGDNTASAAEVTEEETTTAPAADFQTVYHVGDVLHDNNMDIVYAACGEYIEENEFMQPAEGNKYIFLKLAFINTSNKADTSVSFYSFECYADGYNADAYYGGDEGLSATLSPGRSTIGSIYFEVPEDAAEIEVEYDSNLFSDKKITFAFDGDKDSGYTLDKNLTPTEGALKVGETLEGKTVNITYLSCFADTSDNMFINPKDGCHYVTCEIEYENVSNSDVSISCYSFDCYADGINCTQAFYRDDLISATISAGRKVKGTVTFEIPDDASVVEVEYDTSFWTSNRVVFDAEVK